MTKPRSLNLLKPFALAAISISCIMMFSSCGSSSGTDVSDKSKAESNSSSSSTSIKSNAVLDKENAVEVKIAADTGGMIGLNAANDIKIRIAIPREALGKDTSIEAAPLLKAPLEDKDLLAKGFSLEEKGTGKGPALKLPATIIFSIKGQMPENASIVKYHDTDDGCDIIPTKVTNKNGISLLSASVSSFSKYGARKISKPAAQDTDKQQQSDNAAGESWLIKVNDSYSFNNGPMKTTVTVNLQAVNNSGTIDGTYKGSVTGSIEQNMSNEKGSLSVPTVSKDDNVKFDIFFPLASLTPLEPPTSSGLPQLAPLTPLGGSPDWSGWGSFNMSTNANYTAKARGYTKSGSLDVKNSSTPIELSITGSKVRLVVKHPSATMYFNGTVEGQ